MKSCFFREKIEKTFLIKLPSTVYTDDFSRTSEFIVSTYTFPARKDMTKFLPGNSFSLIFQDQGCFFKIKQNTELQTMLKKEIKKQLNRLLRRCRRCRQIGVEAAGKDSGLDWHQIDSLEHGNDKTWNVYQKLLDFYGKQIKIELIERKRK